MILFPKYIGGCMMTTTHTISKDSNDASHKGLYGTFYENANFQNVIFGNHGDHKGGLFHFMSQKSYNGDFHFTSFQSARWTGQIKIPETGAYLFTSPLSYRFCMRIWKNVKFETSKQVLQVMKLDKGMTVGSEKVYRISQEDAKSKLSCTVENGVYKISLQTSETKKDAMDYGDVEIRIHTGTFQKQHDGTISQQTQQEDMSCDLEQGIYKIQIEYMPIAPIQQNEKIFALYWQTPTIMKKAGNDAGDPRYNQIIPEGILLSPDFSDPEYFPKYITENMFDANKIAKLSPKEREYLYFNPDQREKLTKTEKEKLIKKAKELKKNPDSINKEGSYYSGTNEVLMELMKKIHEAAKVENLLEEIGKEHKNDSAKRNRWALAREQMWIFNMAKTEEEKQKVKKKWYDEFFNNKPNKNLDPNYDPENPNALFVDADRDGISNYQATNGFTVLHGGLVVDWVKDYDEDSRYTKYVCRYDRASTAGDPYTDYQKIMGVSNALTVTKNPFVAVCPQVNVQMTGYSLFQNKDETITSDQSFSFTTSNTIAATNTDSTASSNEFGQHVEANIGISAEGPSIGGGGGFSWSHTLSNEQSIANTIESRSDNTSEQRHSVQTHFNTTNRAYLNSYVKYQNTGTVAISKLTPTFNFNLYDKQNDKMEPIVTVRPPNQTGAESVLLSADASYPAADQDTSLVIRSSDTFNSNQIALTSEQWISILEGNKISLSLLQYDGYRADIETSEKSTKGSWIHLQDEIQKHTAHLTLVTPDGKTYDRRIAAPSFEDFGYTGINPKKGPNLIDLYAEYDKIPPLSIGEAIQIAFCDRPNKFLKMSANERFSKTNENGIVYNLNRSNVNIITSLHTKNVLEKQKKNIEAEVVDAKLQLKELEEQKKGLKKGPIEEAYQEQFKKGTDYLEKVKRKQKLLETGFLYDYELLQGMRIIIKVPPIVTAEFKNNDPALQKKAPSVGLDKALDQYPQSIVLTNHHLKDKMYYTITLAPPSDQKKDIKDSTPHLCKEGVLEPSPDPNNPTKVDTKIPHLSNHDVVQVWIGTAKDNKKLLIHKNVGQLPGFRAEKAPIDMSALQKNCHFMSWIVDRSNPLSCKGVELFVPSKETLQNILSFSLKVEDSTDNKNNQQYGPIKVSEVVAYSPLEEINITKQNGYKVKIYFSLFKEFDTNKKRFGQKFTLIGKLNEAKKHPDWDKLKTEPCDINGQRKTCSILAVPFEDPRECNLDTKSFPGEMFTMQNYHDTFSGKFTLAGPLTMKSQVDPEQGDIKNVYPGLTLDGYAHIDPLLLTGIQELNFTLSGTGPDEHVDMEKQLVFKDGKLHLNFHTKTKLTYKQDIDKGRIVGDIALAAFCTICAIINIVQDTKEKSLTYNAEVNGIIGTKPGETSKVLKVNLVVNKDILKPGDKGNNSIEIFNMKI